MSIYDEIRDERARAHAKHGDKSMESAPWDDPTGKRLRILLEEVGEIAREFNEADIGGRPVDAASLRSELVQTATMALAWADRVPLPALPVEGEAGWQNYADEAATLPTKVAELGLEFDPELSGDLRDGLTTRQET